MRLSWIFTLKHLNKICWTSSAIKSSQYLLVLFLPQILSLLCSFSPLSLCGQTMSAVRMFPFKSTSEQLLSAFTFFHKWAIKQEERDDGWQSGTWMALCTWAPQQHWATCKAALGVLCPKSSSSSHNKPFLWTKLKAEEKRTVNFENQKPPVVSLQF